MVELYNTEAIENWKNHPRHIEKQRLGEELWYKSFATRVCKVEPWDTRLKQSI